MPILKWLDQHFEEVILSFFSFSMILFSGLQVFMRYVANSSLAWSEELTRYTFVWTGFFCIGYCIRRRSELRIDTFITMLPFKIRTVLEIILDFFSIILFLLFAYTAVVIIQKTVNLKQISSALGIPMQYVYMAPVVGFFVGVVRLIQRIGMRFLELMGKKAFKKVVDFSTGKGEA
jgi:TRAP-type C4-dicarboxylate transport system permease small subunit